MKTIFLAYSLLKIAVITIRIHYKDTKIVVHSSDDETDFFDIVTTILLRDTLASYLFITCLYYVLRTSIYLMKENGFALKRLE